MTKPWSPAATLLRRAKQDLFAAGQVFGQLRAHGALAELLLINLLLLLLAQSRLCLHLASLYPWLQIQQLKLAIMERLRARPILLDPCETKHFPQQLNLTLRPLELVPHVLQFTLCRL